MCAGSRRRRTPPGRVNGCPPRRNGRRPPASIRPPAARAAIRGVTPTRRGHRQSRSAPSANRPRWARIRRVRHRPGVHQLIGDVWEWTSSGFELYPGFEAFPYREYSEVFFGGDYRVLRGGSFGTDEVGLPRHVPQLGPPDPPADLLRFPAAPAICDRDDADVPTSGLSRPAARRSASAPYARHAFAVRQAGRRAICVAAAPSTPTVSVSPGAPDGEVSRSGTAGGRSGPTRRWGGAAAAALGRGAGRGALGHVRCASAEPPARRSPTGRWAFSHNGWIARVAGQRGGTGPPLPVTDRLTLEAPADSALLWALDPARGWSAADSPGCALGRVTARCCAWRPNRA